MLSPNFVFQKYILPILCCYSLFACTFLDSKSNKAISNEKACIDKLIQLDDSLGKIRNHACETISLSETIDNYVVALNTYDFNACPKALKIAFQQHTQAWLNTKKVTDKYPNLRGEMHKLFEELELSQDSIEFKALHGQIWATWNDVEIHLKK